MLRRTWQEDDFDYHGEFFDLKGVREKPKPYGGTRPLTMNAGATGDGRAFALRNCDAWFTSARMPTFEQAEIAEAAKTVAGAKAEARAMGREIDVYTVGVVVCRPTRKEAEDYHRYVAEEHADWGAIDNMLRIREQPPPDDPVERERWRKRTTTRLSGFSMVGSPDDVAATLARVSAAGFDGIAFSFISYADEFRYFRDEVLPRLERLGIREPVERR